MFTTIEQSSGVKQCLQSHVRDLKVLNCVYNQIANVCPPRLGNIHMILFKMIVLKKKDTSNTIHNKDVVISFIMHLSLEYQIVLRDQ